MKKTCDSGTGKKNFLQEALSFLYPLAPVVIFYLLGLFIFGAFRVAFYLEHFTRVQATAGHVQLFPIGFRIDTMLLCYVLTPAFLALVFLPQKIIFIMRRGLSLYFTLLIALFVFLEIATFPFMAEFDTRLDRVFLEHMVQVREVFEMIIKGHTLSLAVGLIAVAAVCRLLFGFFKNLLGQPAGCSLKKRSLLALAGGLLLISGIRSTFIQHSANINLAAFSTSHLVNQLALNSTYSLAYAYYSRNEMEKDPRKVYGEMDVAEMLGAARASAGIPDSACSNPDIPLLHRQNSGFPGQQPFNLVIILEESMGSEYVGCLGGLPLTPNIDELSKEGLLFTRLYATGTRTVRGIEAILSGFLPTPGTSTVKLGLSQKNFFTIAELLRRRGYATQFIYGGRRTFDSMSGFFLGNGFQEIYDKRDFKRPVFKATWGVSDEDLLGKANDIFSKHGASPFFALILATSNHDPFEFPDGRIELYEQPKATRNNAIKYADYAVGKFFELAKKEAYYKNTLFLIIADHSSRLQGQDLIPVHKFEIPGVIIGPNVKPGTFDKVASQIDMTPTLLDLMGISAEHPAPGRAILQYGDTNAFMEDARVMLLRPALPPSQFTYKNKSLAPAEIDPELLKKALAHALLPGYLYYNQLHHLPNIQN